MDVTHTSETLGRWADRHHPLWLDFLRMALGIFIFAKGLMFIQDTAALQRIIVNSQFGWLSLGLAHYVAFAHLVGGVFIAIGLLTRPMILFQLPILIGAVFFINSKTGFYSENTEFWTSLITLILLLVFLVFGSGRLSMSQYMRTHEEI